MVPLNIYGLEAQRAVSAIASLAIWLRLVTYARGRNKMGVLVRTFLVIVKSINYFLVLLGVFIFGFAHAMFLLNLDQVYDTTGQFQSFGASLLTLVSKELEFR